MKKVGVIFVLVVCFVFASVSAFAAVPETVGQLIEDVESTVPIVIDDSIPPQPEGSGDESVDSQPEIVVTESSAPMPVQVVDMDEALTYSVSGSGWTGDISSSVKNYFSGVLQQNPGLDYVCFKTDKYNTYLFYGSDFSLSGSTFRGTGSFIRYNSDSQLFFRGTDSFSLTDDGYYIYTNLSENYATLIDGGLSVDGKAILFGLCVLLCFDVFRLIFFRFR